MFQFWPSVVKPLLDASRARRIIEIGADEGRNSRCLAAWARTAGARLEIIDPAPSFDMQALADRTPQTVGVHHAPSLDVLGDLMPADVVLIDGDHNWYTVYHELLAIYGEAGSLKAEAPIVICHDVEWPYARRDLYYSIDRIPPEHRQPARIGGLLPGERGLLTAGYNSGSCHAVDEGGPRNGVRTAIEDALALHPDAFRIVWLPVLFGLAVIVPLARLEGGLSALLDQLELSPQLRTLSKTVEQERLRGGRPQIAPMAPNPRQSPVARSYSSALPGDLVISLLKGCVDYRYKGRAMCLNPLDMAIYLALIGQLRPAAVIEIGRFEGGRSLWLADTMTSLGLEPRVISIDLLPAGETGHPGIDARVGDALKLADVLPPDEVRSLGHPLLVIEDSAHDEETCRAVLDYFDPLFASGDYIVVEDGAFGYDGDPQRAADGLTPPSRAIDAFLALRGEDYEIDAACCDSFGYNATFNPNGWLRRK